MCIRDRPRPNEGASIPHRRGARTGIEALAHADTTETEAATDCRPRRRRGKERGRGKKQRLIHTF